MKKLIIIIVIPFCITYPAIAQHVELDALGYLSNEYLDSKKISDYKIFLYRLENKKLTTEEKLLYNYYACICPFLEIKLKDNAPVAENKVRDYVNSKTISALAKGCSELLEYEKKSGSKNETENISKLILHSNSLLQYAAASYVRDNMFTEALIVMQAIQILQSKGNAPPNITDAEMFYYYASAQIKNKETELAENCFYQAIKIDPQYFDAYYDLARLKIDRDIDYHKQMTQLDKLSWTEENHKAYNVLKSAIAKNRNAVVPILEKVLELKPNEELIKKTLLSLYEGLQMTEKYSALKNKI